MTKRIVLIALAALALIATGCKKKHHPVGGREAEPEQTILVISGAPNLAVSVGEEFSLTVESRSGEVDAQTAVWSSSDPAVAKVNATGRVLATGKGKCNIVATVGEISSWVSVSVKDRNPATDEMGHIGSGRTTNGRNNQSTEFSLGETGWKGVLWYSGGNNSVTYYDNGTFKAIWSGTNSFYVGVGYYYGDSSATYWDEMQYDCYFRHGRTGSAGGYDYIGIHGWTLDPLVEFFILDDWFNKPGTNVLGNKKGEFELDGDTYDVYQNTRVQASSISGTNTFPQYFSVRRTARQSGHIDVNAHFKKWASLGMKMGRVYELKYYVETGGGTGTFDCTYFFMSDGKIREI